MDTKIVNSSEVAACPTGRLDVPHYRGNGDGCRCITELFDLLDPDPDQAEAARQLLTSGLAADLDTVNSLAEVPLDEAALDRIAALLHEVLNSTEPIEREVLTYFALEVSLCPLHLCDYAICFDDDAAECRAIRLIHPQHHT